MTRRERVDVFVLGPLQLVENVLWAVCTFVSARLAATKD